MHSNSKSSKTPNAGDRMRTPVFADVVSGVVERYVKSNGLFTDTDAMRTDITTNAKVEYHVQDDFTVAVCAYHGKIFVGVSKRNPNDKHNSLRGKSLALARCLREVVMSKFDVLAEE